jgi:hypothetical protein
MSGYNNKMDPKAIVWEGMDFIHMAQVWNKMAAAFEVLM